MKSIMRPALLILLVMTIGMVSTAHAAYPQTLTSPYPWVNMPRPTDDPRWAKAFEHWDKRGETDDALAALAIVEKIAKEKPDSYDAQLWLGRMNSLMSMRDVSKRNEYCMKSIAAADRALKLKPGDVLANYWRLNSAQLLRDLTEREYQQLREIFKPYRNIRPFPVPEEPSELWTEALKKWDARADLEQARAALEDFKKLADQNPDSLEPQIYVAMSYWYLSHFEKTEEDLAEMVWNGADYARRAVEIEPRNPAARFAVAMVLGHYGDHTSLINVVRYSVEIAKSLQVMTEEDPTFMYGAFSRYISESIGAVGEVALNVGSLLGFPKEQIERATIYSTKLEPACFDNHIALAKLHIALGRMDEAKKELELVINADPAALKYYEPENIMDQKEAQRMYDKHFKQ